MSDTQTFSSSKSARLMTLRRKAAAAEMANPRKSGLAASPPAIVIEGTTLPAGQTSGYLLNTAAGQAVLRSYGGSSYLAGSLIGRVKSAVIGTSGGNIGAGDGSQASFSRRYFLADAAKVTLRLKRSALPYRFLVDNRYVDLAGTVSTAASPTSTDEYVSLDFSSAGGRALREIGVEAQGDNSAWGVYVGATETVREPAAADDLVSCLLGDSYVHGTGTTALGDGFGAVMADWLGIRAHSNSGSGGTGWVSNAGGGVYTFDQRIENGDLELAGMPGLIVLMGSYNDRNQLAETITAHALAGLVAARARYPDALIAVLGVFPASSGPSAAIIAAENAVAAAVTQFGDAWTRFIPISTRASGNLITGTGRSGTASGAGNSDLYTGIDQVHPTPAGHAFIGRFVAQAILSAFSAD
jgi:lysophospholipase L1-like esterase